MKRVIAFVAMLLLLSTTSACVPKANGNPELRLTPVAFRLMVWDEEGFEVTTETDDGGWAADITISGIASQPGAIVMIMDPIVGTEHPSPYSYVGFVPHLSWQAFGPDVASVSFAAEMLLLEGWSMQCTTEVNGAVAHSSGKIKNTTSLPVEMTATCIY